MPGTRSSLRRLPKLVCAAGHPRLISLCHKDVDGRDEPGHDGVDRSRSISSLAAGHVEARVEELHRRFADPRVDAVTIDAGSIDAGLGKFVFALVVALVDEDIVVDSAR